MADHMITIKDNGTCDPLQLGDIVRGKDTVSFFSELKGIAVISINRPDIFGIYQFEVPSGATMVLPVRADASPGDFVYRYCGALTGEHQTFDGWGGDGRVIGGPEFEADGAGSDGRVIGGPDT